MLMLTTFRKLRAQGKNIYRLDKPAWTMKAGTLSKAPFMNPEIDMLIPASSESFASRLVAQQNCDEYNKLQGRLGAPLATVTVVPARQVPYAGI